MEERRRKLLSRKKDTLQNRPTFLERLSVLLMEGYTFHDGITLLLPHHIKDYNPVQVAIENDLREGLSVTHILGRFGFSSSTLLPVAIAEMDGRLAIALEGMATRLRKKEEKQKKLKNLLAYPMVLFVFIAALLIAFRRFFLPNIEMLAVSRVNEKNGFISALPSVVTKIPDVMLGVILLSICFIIVSMIIYNKLEPKVKIQVMMTLPIVRIFFSMIKTRDFASEVGGLLQSGLAIQNVLDVLIDQKLDRVLSTIATQVKEQIIYGEPLHAAIHLTEGLMPQLAAFAKHGMDSGHLPKELLIYSQHLDETLDEKLTKALSVLQPALFSIIAICILAAYLALLLPVYSMIDKL